MKKDLTMKQKIKYIKSKGAILTLKNPVQWKGEQFRQILVENVRKENKTYCIVSRCFDTERKSTLEELTDLIDWIDYQNRLELCKELRGDGR